MIALLLCMLLFVGGHVTHAQDEAGDLLGRINTLRASLGRAPYSLNGALSGAAQDQAQWIVNTGNVSHTREDGSGPRSRALAYGYGTTDVSENIYGGTNATVNDAWTFWVNSGIHYRGLVNERYQQVGIGIARGGWGAAFVLVFGNPGGPPPAPPAPPAGSSGGGNNAPAAAPEQPSYIVGLDPNGNIMHEVQSGDTLGDILLIYGYTWDILPYIQQINGIGDVRDLEIGSILLVPPYYGTYTPTPNTEPPTATPSPTFQYPTPFPEDPLFALSHTPPPNATPPDAMMVAAVPTGMGTPLATAAAETQIAALPTADGGVIEAAQVEQGQGIPTWLLIGIGLQVVIVVGAAFEFSRRLRRK